MLKPTTRLFTLLTSRATTIPPSTPKPALPATPTLLNALLHGVPDLDTYSYRAALLTTMRSTISKPLLVPGSRVHGLIYGIPEAELEREAAAKLKVKETKKTNPKPLPSPMLNVPDFETGLIWSSASSAAAAMVGISTFFLGAGKAKGCGAKSVFAGKGMAGDK